MLYANILKVRSRHPLCHSNDWEQNTGAENEYGNWIKLCELTQTVTVSGTHFDMYITSI